MGKAEKSRIQGSKTVLIIEGVRENGTKFRPSDWPERLSSTFAGFGKDHRLVYASNIRPGVLNGQKVLFVEPELQEQNPAVYQAVMKFVRENNLRTREQDDSAE